MSDKMTIVHVAAECYPIAKTGGLGDVVGALPKYLNQAGHDACVIMPAYRTKNYYERTWTEEFTGQIYVWNTPYPYTIYKCSDPALGFDIYSVDIANFFASADIYTHNDTWRFTLFQRAVCEWLCTWKEPIDVVHCHDHHTGLIPFFMQHAVDFRALALIPSVFTIHNGLYQGQTTWENSLLLPPYDTWKWGMLDWNHMINPMATGIKCAWKFTTVSNGYLNELMGYAYGIEALIRQEAHKSVGIVNGIDSAIWDPHTDRALAQKYTSDTVFKGKYANKLEICRIFGLDPDLPLFSFIGRLVPEKGSDLLAPTIYNSIYDTQGHANFLVLGSGVNETENDLNKLKHYIPDHFNCYIGYNEHLSHKIYSAADFMLMPSLMEPCGLNQMYAMRYGTMPIVSAVGGLNQTVLDIGEAHGFGIKHTPGDVGSIRYNIERAMSVYRDESYLHRLRRQMMGIDHSWETASQQYIKLYKNLSA